MALGLDELMTIVKPPPRGGRDLDWRRTESELGWRLPSDYRRLVEAYGPGIFDDFIIVFQPLGTAVDSVCLIVEEARRALATAREIQKNVPEAVPFDVSERGAAVVPWGRTVNGEDLWWLALDVNPDRWSVVATDYTGDTAGWLAHDGGVTSFLADVFTGRHRSDIFPNGFPSKAPVFTAWT